MTWPTDMDTARMQATINQQAERIHQLKDQVTRLQKMVRAADTYIRSDDHSPYWYERWVFDIYPEAIDRKDLDPIE